MEQQMHGGQKTVGEILHGIAPEPAKVEPLIIVSGQPRTGTSLMMRILHDSGITVWADDPHSYELVRTKDLSKDNEWVRELPQGSAMKVLHPQVFHLPLNIVYKIIWMTRDPQQTAKSQRKFRREFMKEDIPRQWVPRQMKRIVAQETQALRILRNGGADLMEVSFAGLVVHPSCIHYTIIPISKWLGIPLITHPIVPRSPLCSPLPVGELERGGTSLLTKEN